MVRKDKMMKRILIALMTIMGMAGIAMAYDYTFNFSHKTPADMAGFRIKYGTAKGGPYPNTIQCGKPTLKADQTMDCLATGVATAPGVMYAVAVAYTAAGAESPYSQEATYTPGAPEGMKFTITGTVFLTPAQ
jgi:hypothetical protein